MDNPFRPPARTVQPTEEHAQLAMREVSLLMEPLVRWLLRSGVSYGTFADSLKPVFVAVARAELEHSGARPTHSALSVLSGVHRKDVRALADALARPSPLRGVPLASQVFTRWLTDAAFLGPDGHPMPLPRSGAAPSFESLARQVSTDVHPRTVLDELLRLGLVAVEQDVVSARAAAFVPAHGLAETTALFAANVADHIAAAVHNLPLDAPKFVEQSLFGRGLTRASAEHLSEAARRAWAAAFATMAAEARERFDEDAGKGGSHRIRFGTYFYAEVDPASVAAPPEEDTP
jgi:hypothetical protein